MATFFARSDELRNFCLNFISEYLFNFASVEFANVAYQVVDFYLAVNFYYFFMCFLFHFIDVLIEDFRNSVFVDFFKYNDLVDARTHFWRQRFFDRRFENACGIVWI